MDEGTEETASERESRIKLIRRMLNLLQRKGLSLNEERELVDMVGDVKHNLPDDIKEELEKFREKIRDKALRDQGRAKERKTTSTKTEMGKIFEQLQRYKEAKKAKLKKASRRKRR